MSVGDSVRSADSWHRRIADALDAMNVVWCPTCTNATNAYTITPTITISRLINGQQFRFIASAANTGAATLAVGSMTAKAIKRKDGSTALSASDMPNAVPILVQYDSSGDVFRLIQPWI